MNTVSPIPTVARGISPLPPTFARANPMAMLCAIGPVEAQRLLDINTANRNPSRRTVEKYARDIANGRFDLSNDAISVYTSGKLATGQHRCMAVIQAGEPILSLVLLGLPEKSAAKLDQPKQRRVVQNLQIRAGLTGVELDLSGADVATANAFVPNTNTTMTTEEVQNVLARYEPHLLFAKQHLPSAAAPVRAAVAAIHMAGAEPEVLARFCEAVATGVTNGPQEGIVVRLRDKLAVAPRTGDGRRDARRLTMNAFKFFERNEAPSKLCLLDYDIYALGTLEESN